MLSREVTDFIIKLSTCPEKQAIDDSLIAQLQDRFSHPDKEYLNEEDLIFVKDIFEARGKQIIDTDLDYTKDTQGINGIWIDWAKQLASGNAELSFFHLLFPTVLDKIDPNSLHSIQESSDEVAGDETEIDCKSLYLGSDNESIYTISNLLTHLIKYPLSTYRKNSAQLFPMSLIELSRFRQGAGHQNFWDYLSNKVFPHLQHYGEIPVPVLPLFLELVATYFEMKTEQSDFSHFKKKFQQWLGCLYECSVSDVNQLYGVQINFSGTSRYLIELLIDIHEAQTFALDEHFESIAQWLNQYNPSYVVLHSALDCLNQKMASGKFFSVTLFKTLLETCAADPALDDQLTEKMCLLLSEIESADALQERMIEQLGLIYALRWEKVVDTPNDYLRLQTRVNASWIRLAQYLAGAKMIPDNYYQFLMPTIQNNREDVYNCPLTDYSLSHYVLSADKSRLISLDVCMNHYRSSGTFRYWKDGEWFSFSAIEIERIQYAAKPFASQYQVLLSKESAPSVSLKTIKAIKSMIDGCLYHKGLIYGREYDANELAEADRAIQDFAEYYHSLDLPEQDALKQQAIIFRGEKKTFEQLWEGAVIKRECIAIFGLYLMQLVADYAPHWSFTKEIEKKLAKDLEMMRERSSHQVFNDYECLSKAEAEQRCQLMFLSLMTHSFKMRLLCGKSIEFWDCTNTVHGVAKQLFDQLIPMIQNKDFSDSRFVYAQIIESIINPALAAMPFSVRVTSSDAFRRWLEDVKNARVLSREFQCHEPEPLLLFLLSLETKPRDIIHELIRTCAQEKHVLDKKLRANIIVIKFISSLEISQAEMILLALSYFQYPASHLETYRAVQRFIVSEMESLNPKPPRSITFFTADKHELKSPAAASTEMSEESIPESIKEIIDSLKCGLHKTADLSPGEIKKFTNYLRVLEEPILTPQESRDSRIEAGVDYMGTIS